MPGPPQQIVKATSEDAKGKTKNFLQCSQLHHQGKRQQRQRSQWYGQNLCGCVWINYGNH